MFHRKTHRNRNRVVTAKTQKKKLPRIWTSLWAPLAIIQCRWPYNQTLKKSLRTIWLREAKPGGFQTWVFPTFFGKGPDCVADPFGTVPRGCSQEAEKEEKDKSGKSSDHPRANQENPRKWGKSQKGQKRTKKEGQVQVGKPPCLKPPPPPFSGPWFDRGNESQTSTANHCRETVHSSLEGPRTPVGARELQSESDVRRPWCFLQGSVNGGFQTVVRVFWGNEIPLAPFYLNLTSFLPQFYLFFTFFKPLFNLCFVTNLEPRFGNHGLQTLGFSYIHWPMSTWPSLQIRRCNWTISNRDMFRSFRSHSGLLGCVFGCVLEDVHRF